MYWKSIMSLVSTLKWKSLHPNLYCDLFERGAHLYLGVDIILVKRFSKHTLSMYFLSMKIDPNHVSACFFFNFSIMLFPKLVKMTKTHPFNSNFAWFSTPTWCLYKHHLLLKIDPNYMIFYFFLRGWYPTSNTSSPPPRTYSTSTKFFLVQCEMCYITVIKQMYWSQGNLKGESLVAAILPSCMEASYCTSRLFHI